METTTDPVPVATPAPVSEKEIDELHAAIMDAFWECYRLMEKETNWNESRREYQSRTWSDLFIVHSTISNAGSIARLIGVLSRDPERHTGISKIRLSGD